MFFLDRETLLTPELLNKLITEFRTKHRPKLEKRKHQYDGMHAILRKEYADKTKPCNRVVTNFCKIITDTYAGYICGKPVAYTSNAADAAMEDVQEVINYNDTDAQDMAFVKNALIYGIAYEMQWLDMDGKTRYAQINPLDCFAIYDNTLDGALLYFVRWYKADSASDNDIYHVEVYDRHINLDVYEMHGLNGALYLIKEDSHFYNDVPVSIFKLNDDDSNIFDSIVSLNDAYNELQSSEIDDYQAFVDAYMFLKGATLGDDPDAAAEMRKNRFLELPYDSDIGFLTKTFNDAQIENMLDNIKKNIFKVTACPDMADDTFLAQSGTALAYKLVGFENVASGIVANMTKALQRRIELICNILRLKGNDALWRDINISFTRNLPQNLTEIIQLVNALRGLVSDKTLLAQIPFIDDVQAELEAVEQQRAANMALYSFDTQTDDEEAEEEQEAV